mmetsp:Transcript_53426/g.117291  ORF Transcript_53426/g.117291 Transcript_53426/m.117291 type:complete len:418 (+) Transcript_53426:103-1356(+)
MRWQWLLLAPERCWSSFLSGRGAVDSEAAVQQGDAPLLPALPAVDGMLSPSKSTGVDQPVGIGTEDLTQQFTGYYNDAFGLQAQPQGAATLAVHLAPKLVPMLRASAAEKQAAYSLTDGVVTQVLVAEQDKVGQAMRRKASKVAVDAAVKAASRAAGTAIAQGYTVTKRMLVNEARRSCRKMSKLPAFPALCGRRAELLFTKLRNGSLNKWSRAVQAKALKAAVRRATHEAARSIAGLEAARCPPAAFAAANRTFETEWRRYEALYQQEAEKEVKALEAKRSAYWFKANQEILENVAKAVKTAVWTAPIVEAEQKATLAAETTADRVAQAVAQHHLGPRFVKAAETILPRAMAAADKETMDHWNPKWNKMKRRKGDAPPKPFSTDFGKALAKTPMSTLSTQQDLDSQLPPLELPGLA